MNKSLRWMAAASFAAGLMMPAGPAEAGWEEDGRDTHAAGEIMGTVKDPSGGALVGAQVSVLTPQRTVVATTTTDRSGKFAVAGVADGQYVVIIRYPGLKERQAVVTVSSGSATPP